MGGLNSEVNQNTHSILLESAYFKPSSIRKTCKAIALKSESSQRFEKGVDIQGVVPALNRAASLMAQLCGGKVATGIIDQYPNPIASHASITVNIPYVNKIIGIKCSQEEIKALLERLNMHIEDEGPEILHAVPPSFRVDLHEPIDIVEEVARLKGYQHVPSTFPKTHLYARNRNKYQVLSSLTREILISIGFYEVINYSFLSPDFLHFLNLPDSDPRMEPVKILNPISEAQSVLRTTIIPSILANLRDNLHHKNNTIKIFELSTVFMKATDNALPVEKKRIAGLMSGSRYNECWNLPHTEVDFYDIKGCVEILLQRLPLPPFRCIHRAKEPFLHPSNCLSLFLNEDEIGIMGQVHPDILEKFDIHKNAYIFDLDFDKLVNLSMEKSFYEPFFRNPPVYRDLALIVDQSLPAQSVNQSILAFKNSLISDVTIFDLFQGESIPPGKKSLAYRIKFQSQDRNLTDREINKIQERLLTHLANAVGAELRP
jgi:phenylalanyl-tRNA synthetase beta chain